MIPEVEYTSVGGAAVAYQVIGDGDVDLVMMPPVSSNIDIQWDLPEWVSFHRRLGSFARVIVFDKRGTGLSDPLPRSGVPTLEERVDDVLGVMEAVGSKRAALFGNGEGGPVAILFAATHPNRTTHLILCNTTSCLMKRPDHPWGWDPGTTPMDETLADFGKPLPSVVERLAPSKADDPEFERWLTRWIRGGSSPSLYLALQKVAMEIDVRPVLSAVGAPTLVMHTRDNAILDIGNARYIADHVAGARFVELDGGDHHPHLQPAASVVEEIQELLTGTRPTREAERVLATVMFTDIVGSTELAAQMGDRRWKELLSRHHECVRGQLARFRGREIRTAGDGFLATFDGPARAVECAWAVHEAVERVGLRLRAGVHTGEVEILEDTIAGIAVHVAARISGLAGVGEVLASRTVKDLVAGSGIRWGDRGEHQLKGVPEPWHVYAAER